MVVETLGTFTQSEIEYIYETRRIMGELDYNTEMAERRAKAREEGLAEGLKEGRAEGRREGRAENALEIASKMKTMGFSNEQIQAATGLPVETIEQM